MPRYTVVKSDATLQSDGFGVPGITMSNQLDDNHSDKGLLEALVADLDPQQKYTFRVKALTKSTEGAWTGEIPVTTSSRLLPDEPRSSSIKGNLNELIKKYGIYTLCAVLTFCTFLNSPGLCTPFLFSIFIFFSLIFLVGGLGTSSLSFFLLV